jgi:hypothetical protein
MKNRKTAANVAGCASIALFLATWPVSWVFENLHVDLPPLLDIAILFVGAILLALLAARHGTKWWLLAALPPVLFAAALLLFFPPI